MNPATGAGPLREVKRGALPLANDYPPLHWRQVIAPAAPGCRRHGGPRDGAGAQPGGLGAQPPAQEPPAGGGRDALGGVQFAPPGGRC